MKRTDATFLTKSLPAGTAPAAGTYRLKGGRLALQAGYATKAFSATERTAECVLSYPGRDYDGDTINPAGGDWQREFAANPVVNWTHDIPIGRGTTPELKAFTVDGQTLKLPVATTTFFQSAADLRGLRLYGRDGAGNVTHEYRPDECLHAADSAARLVLDGIADGVSIEFRPDGPQGKAFWPTGKKSLLLGRDEMHWERWLGLGWAHALHVKNPNAAVIAEKAFRIAESGKYGGHTLSPFVMKAFAGMKHTPKFHRVGKAMPTDDDDMIEADPTETTATEPADGTPAADPAAAPGTDVMTPTPRAFMQGIQALEDAAAGLEDTLTSGTLEHEKGIAGLQDLIDEIRDVSAKANAMAKKLFPSAGFDPAGDAVPGSDAPTVNDSGAVTNKAFPDGYPVRFRRAAGGGYERIKPPAKTVAKAQTDPDAARLKALAAQLEENEAFLREAEREQRLAARNRDRLARTY